MLRPDERESHLKNFAEVEASFRLEDMDPSGDTLYEAAKSAVLSGNMTLDEAIDFALQGSVAEIEAETAHTVDA